MCGIYGVVSFDKADFTSLEKIFKTLEIGNAKRGPDEQRKIIINQGLQAIIGHSRLAITGLDQTGIQPVEIITPDQKAIFVFNGQIYNAQELAKTHAIEFDEKNNSDTKIATLLFDHSDQFNGMFAMAKLSLTRKELVLKRDPFGIKPLYWAKTNSFISFSSSLKALVQALPTTPKLHSLSCRALEELNFNPFPNALLKDIYQVLPGQTIIFSEQEQRQSSTSLQALRTPKNNPSSYSPKALKDLFLHNLEQTIPKHKHQPFVVALSSGLDSSLIAAGCVKLGYKPKTITLDFPNDRQTASEATRAKKIANFLGLEHIVVKVSREVVKRELKDFENAIDHPSKDGLNTYFLTKEARNHAKVILSGLGADELFFGYRSTVQAYKMLTADPFSKFINATMAMFAPQRIKYHLGVDFFQRLSQHKSALEMVIKSRANPEASFYGCKDLFDFGFELSKFPLTSQFIFSELFCYTQPVLLRDSDWASMHFGVELRVPFLNQQFTSTVIHWQEKALKKCLEKQWLWELAKEWGIAKFVSTTKLGFVPPYKAASPNELINRFLQP